jgi:hypothetical protein
MHQCFALNKCHLGLALVYNLTLPVFVHRNDREGGAGLTPREAEDGHQS